jgi:hypothetical protein
MQDTADSEAAQPQDHTPPPNPVGGPVKAAWREGTLTRAREIEALRAWVLYKPPPEYYRDLKLSDAICWHLTAARDAATGARLNPPTKFLWMFRSSSRFERAMSNLDAAESQLLNIAPPHYVLGQMPSILNDVQRHLIPTDPRRQELERIARKLGLKDQDPPLLEAGRQEQTESIENSRQEMIVKGERGKIVTALRGARSAALREQLRVRSFIIVLIATIVAMTVLAIGVAVMGYTNPTAVPLCFAPEEAGKAVVVCPTAHSRTFPATLAAGPAADIAVRQAARKGDLFLVEIIGLIAASVAAAVAIRGIRGSSEAVHLPVLLALLKLPMGALTAFLGLLLMRGQFVPGLSALDTSAQILAWALVFGYAQQLFTRFVDRQGQTVLDSVRAADKRSEPIPP